MSEKSKPFKVFVVTPVYNDWESFSILLKKLDALVSKSNFACGVIAVDDGSTQLIGNLENLTSLCCVDIIHLARNLGHQKAIAIGLAYVRENISCDAIIVMDADGEDDPRDIPRLIASHYRDPQKIIFAMRGRRTESVKFHFFYRLYRSFFRLLTGRRIAFGNYSLIPAIFIERVTYLPEIWNHYAAGIMHANIPWIVVSIERGKRYKGQSQMNFVALVLHGLSAMSVYIEVLTVRLMLSLVVIILFVVIGFGIMLYYRFFTTLAIPGWATNVAIGLTIILSQAMLFITLLTFLVLNYRSSKFFIPAKNYRDYFLSIERVK